MLGEVRGVMEAGVEIIRSDQLQASSGDLEVLYNPRTSSLSRRKPTRPWVTAITATRPISTVESQAICDDDQRPRPSGTGLGASEAAGGILSKSPDISWKRRGPIRRSGISIAFGPCSLSLCRHSITLLHRYWLAVYLHRFSQRGKACLATANNLQTRQETRMLLTDVPASSTVGS